MISTRVELATIQEARSQVSEWLFQFREKNESRDSSSCSLAMVRFRARRVADILLTCRAGAIRVWDCPRVAVRARNHFRGHDDTLSSGTPNSGDSAHVFCTMFETADTECRTVTFVVLPVDPSFKMLL